MKKRSPENSSKALILWVLLRPISSILCPCPLPKFGKKKLRSWGEAAAAATETAVGSWEIREVFFESELRATEEWGWSEDLEMSFWSKAKNFPFSECIKADFYCLSINSIEKNTHSTTHPSKLDVTLIRQPISTHKLHQDHYSHTTTVITTAVSQLDCIQPYSYQS